MRTYFSRLAVLALALMLVLSACGGQPAATEEAAPAGTEAPAATEAAPAATEEAAPSEGGFQIPEIEDGKFNVAMVLIGPHDDGGWSQAHYEGLLYVEENVENVHVAYIENVPEGADS